MSLFNGIKWPYATMQQLNLDWIMETIKGKQDALTDDQMAAVNSGATEETVELPIAFAEPSNAVGTPAEGLSTRTARMSYAVSRGKRYLKFYGYLNFQINTPSAGDKIYTYATPNMPEMPTSFDISNVGIAVDQTGAIIHSNNIKLRFTEGSKNIQLIVTAPATSSNVHVDLFPCIYQLSDFGD
jgi:hypothetical protein